MHRQSDQSRTSVIPQTKAAAPLGAAAMAALWGRTFTAERDHRAEPDAKAQRRGQISRQLKADLQEVINDGND
jgi:hypothetical protein